MSHFKVPTCVSSAVVRAACCIALFAAFIGGCRTYESTITDPGPSMVHTTIAGRITDEAGNGLSGAAVNAGTQSATTDADGIFFIPDASVESGHAAIVAKKPGYFNGARAAMPKAGGVTYMTLRMVTATSVGTIDASTGGRVSMSDGSALSLPSNSVVTASGAPYSGQVSVFARHLDPTDPKYASEFPGDLQAIAADSKTTVLRTFGVMLAELHGSNGELLQPAPGKPAQITVAIPAGLQASATSTIPLWYFDEPSGYWKEEGTATLTGSAFVGSVSHFTAWNCDYSGPWGEIHGRVVCDGVPLPGIVVSLGALVQGGLPVVVTDATGEFTARVPAAWDKLEYQILASNNNGLYFTNAPVKVYVDPNTTKELGDISLDSRCPSYLSGTILDCVGNPIGGMVIAKWSGGAPAFIYTKDGHFKIIVSENVSVTLTATANNGYVSPMQTVQSGAMGVEVSVPDIVACSVTNGYTDYPGTYDGSIVSYSDDGSKLACFSSDKKNVVVFDAASMSELVRIPSASTSQAYAPYLHFSPDGTKILVGSGYYRGSFDVYGTDGTRLTSSSVPAQSAIFTQDGNSVLASNGETNFVYNLAQNAQTSSATSPEPYGWFVGLAPGGAKAYLLGGSKIYLWDIASNSVASSFTQPGGGPNDSLGYGEYARLSYDRTLLGYGTSKLNFLDIPNQALVSTSTIQMPYLYGIAPDDKSFIGLYRSGQSTTVGLFKATDGSLLRTMDVDPAFGACSGVTIAPDGAHAVAVYPVGIRIWNLK